MCGIVGYVGNRPAAPLLLEGLRRLEYRGYDSAGLCTLNGGSLNLRKCVGRVAQLDALLRKRPVAGSAGISHTRWATHGLPNDANAHPHLDQSGNLAVIHNGIIENYAAIRADLRRRGHVFRSQTDSEVFTHLIGEQVDQRLSRGRHLTLELMVEALNAATRQAKGAFAIAVIHSGLPGHLFGARRGSPLVVGVGRNEAFLGSDVSPFFAHTRKVIFLQDGDIAAISPGTVRVTAGGKPAKRPVTASRWSPESVERGNYPHYMLKEIFEQPDRVADALRLMLRPGSGDVAFEQPALSPGSLAKVRRLLFVACGTSWHAALVGEYLIESLAGIPVEVECGSEMRYRNRPMDKGTLVISLSQSGETADTLAAIRGARDQGARTVAIVNVAGSTIARESHDAILMRAGPEIGVASTKAFEMQLLWLTLLALALGRRRGRISPAEGKGFLRELSAIPAKIRRILDNDAAIRVVARKYARVNEFLFMGRQFNFPIALEGALKLKEISYIHADGYPSAEMKHGPIALVSPKFPSVFVAPKDAMYEKNMSNIEEIRARSGPVIAVATQGDTEMPHKAEKVLFIPPTLDFLQPLLTVVPLQLLAYHIAVLRGCDVDKPRNLAKSVTVE